ncbi:MAG: GNAT family N-acetyltransferase [Firmicutes bacterium]|jgi:ribosomal protein S18 acetylase RimI-like enzyme|nr:GNAT family N-acetyltransferase [Bacillota bacterium]MCL5064571.1 GNAT family N-acetyltransferase [Bacillota bacterium]
MLTIRQYQSSDQEVVWNLHNPALAQIGAHRGLGPWDDDLQNIEIVYLRNRGDFLVGEYEGQVVAMGALMKVSTAMAEIKRMRVHPSFQGRHFGTALLEALEYRAKALGYKVLRLDTTIKQNAAQILYKNHGFEETTRKSDTIFMQKGIS